MVTEPPASHPPTLSPEAAADGARPHPVRSISAAYGPTLSGQVLSNPDGVDRATRRRVIAASFIGNFVEWFDYAVYGYLATTIAAVFFPEADRQAALLSTFALFAISFLIRPLGGFFWGHLGDRVGRRVALSWSILLMSLATFCIALIPGYATIGLWAPVLLLLMRVVQGFSASGEYAGASAFLVEYAPAHRRGLYAAIVPASTATGLLVGSLIAALLYGVLSPDELSDWGWRVPFLLAAPLGLIGRYIRTKLEDTPVFTQMAAEDEAIKAPAGDLFRRYWKVLILTSGAVLLNAVGFYLLLSYMPTYLTEAVGLSPTLSNLSTTVALLTYIGFILLTGLLSDRLGRKRVLLSASVLFLLLTVPLFTVLDTGVFTLILCVQVALGALLTLNDGTLPSFLAEQFPTRVRYSGFAVCFNLSNALFGGTAPFMATFLIGASGSDLAPAWYLAAAALVSLIAVALAKETFRTPLAHD